MGELFATYPEAGLGIAHVHASVGEFREMSQHLQSVFDSLQHTDLDLKEQASVLRACAALFISVGHWKEGADSYAESVRVNPESTSIDWMKPATLYAYADDQEGFRSHCRTMADHFRNSAVPANAERTVNSMLLMGDSFNEELAPQQYPVKAFLESVDEKTMPVAYQGWFLAMRVLLACRSEQFGGLTEAEEWLEKSKPSDEFLTNYVGMLQRAVMSVILAKQGRNDEARKLSEELEVLLHSQHGLMWKGDGNLDGRTILSNDHVIHDLLIPELLRREVERLKE